MQIYDLLNNKISLKAFNVFVFVSLFIVIFSGLYYQYNAANHSTSANFHNNNYNKSLEIREKFRLIFDKLEYQFIQAEAENLEKLDLLYELYGNQKENFDLKNAENILNKNVQFGKYEIFMINKDYIIEKASYEKEIGLNLGQFKIVKDLFDDMFSKKIKVDISSPKLDIDSRLKRYLIKLSGDQKYILQIGFSLDYSSEINKQLHYLSSDTSKTSLYLATEFFIQDIDVKSGDFKSKDEHNEYCRKITKEFLLDINIALKDPKIEQLANIDTRTISLNKALEKIIPLNETLISFVDKQDNKVNSYSATGSLFGKESGTLLFIKTSFPLAPLDKSLKNNLNTFLFITILVLLFLIIFECFKQKQITSKITSITKVIKNNEMINDETSAIKDISLLIDSYNQMLSELNYQIKMNKELSYIDSLTEIKNRKAYDEKIEELVSLYKRYGTTFSIAIFDADDFKEINDTYGHSFGDTVLKNIAKALQSSIRNGDMVYRIGGEEFIVIFPSTTLEESKTVIEKIRKKVDISLNTENKVKITLSIGLTEISDQDSKDSIFKKIDRFLYVSKGSGKNCVTSG
ncbi:GGDEF domain-containing protein [Psychromonas arctica]|uniref:GGDEF domain-containing protein n=1 Tax=Psychromonas arctica TaxID=168275 RepID=UPI0004915314|nr:GGDEF domain-containing protein [Psychromonas arctica]